MASMFLKLSQKGFISAEYIPVNAVATIVSRLDAELPEDIAAEVRYDNKKYSVSKKMDAWLISESGSVLEVVNRASNWSQS